MTLAILLLSLAITVAGRNVYPDVDAGEEMAMMKDSPQRRALKDRTSLFKHLLCQARLKNLNCQKRSLCLKTGHKFESTCEYQAAVCRGQISMAAVHVQCKDSTMRDCSEYKGSTCGNEEMNPVCGYHTNNYYPNICRACESQLDRQDSGRFVQLTVHHRCIMSKTGDSRLLNWARKVSALATGS